MALGDLPPRLLLPDYWEEKRPAIIRPGGDILRAERERLKIAGILPGIGGLLGGEPKEAPTYVNQTYTNVVGAPTATLPSGWAAGDLLLLWQYSVDSGGPPTPTLKSGFTNIRTLTPIGSYAGSRLSYKIAASGETNVALTDHGSTNVAILIAIRGVDQANPIDGSNGNTQGTTSSVSVTGFNTTDDNSLIVAIASTQTGNTGSFSATGWANASLSGVTERADYSADYFQASTITGVMSSAGATGNITGTSSVSAGHGNVIAAIRGR